MTKILVDQFRCPADLIHFRLPENDQGVPGFFEFGEGISCYGQCASGATKPQFSNGLHDASDEVRLENGAVWLPFDPTVVAENFRMERYVPSTSAGFNAISDENWMRNFYYALRPALPIAVRKYFQRSYLRGWKEIRFPHWPVDCTVESLCERLLLWSIRASGLEKIPFIWFWPDGATGCAAITHDVERTPGRDFCSELMDIDDSFHIKSSFQVVPQKRYDVPRTYLDEIRRRGFEVNVHDLNHDGYLFSNREEFLRRAALINRYAEEFGAKGFRSGVLYRNLEWFGALRFSYDMSVPNVANLDFQRGGCCTVMPYFIGDILELPLTTAQDYTLFHILGDYSYTVWRQQVGLIGAKHGMATFNVHPDYLCTSKARRGYLLLLEMLASLRQEENWWVALPGEIDRWWRQRRELKLVRNGEKWRIEGAGKERARLAYAYANGDHLEYVVPAPSDSAVIIENVAVLPTTQRSAVSNAVRAI